MNVEALEAIELNLPTVLKRRGDVFWPDDLIVISEEEIKNRPEGDSIEEALFDEESEGQDPLDQLPSNIDSLVDDILGSNRHSLEDAMSPELLDLVGTLRERFGDDFPGAPGGEGPATVPTGGSSNTNFPTVSPDVLAFYLPWHYFSPRLWGIYLIVEGLEALALQIRNLSLGYLSKRESARVAKIFLFHHEAYHNAVESFSARLEVSHRVPCYISGFQIAWRTGFNAGRLHEEGLATAYAAEKVRSSAFEDIYPAGFLRKNKRKVAYAVLQRIIRGMPPAYRTALSLNSSRDFRDGQAIFLEENHNNCFPLVRPKTTGSPNLWEASPHILRPSLQRNASFSYVVRRSHPSIRRALNVPHFKRTQFLAKLKAREGGAEIAQGGGKHPKWKGANGSIVPIPGHRELARGTCRAILRQLGVSESLTEFMSQSGPLRVTQP